MKLITISGPPSSGKTSVILRLIESLRRRNGKNRCREIRLSTSFDQVRYREAGIPVEIGFFRQGLSGSFFYQQYRRRGKMGRQERVRYARHGERGALQPLPPHISEIPRSASSIICRESTRREKIGPMLKFADYVVITKGDIVSQAEREVFKFNVRQVNTSARILFVNGITGQGSFMLAKHLQKAPEITTLSDMHLRFTTPASVCSYCTQERHGSAKSFRTV